MNQMTHAQVMMMINFDDGHVSQIFCNSETEEKLTNIDTKMKFSFIQMTKKTAM